MYHGNQSIKFWWSPDWVMDCPIPEVYNEIDSISDDGSIRWGGVTGIQHLPYQNHMGPKWKYGCLVLCACVRGGLYTIDECNAARDWALSEGFIRNDNYVLMSGTRLSEKIANRFGKHVNSNMEIQEGRGHFYITSGNHEFNSAGIGQLH
jgi:hypothetical protein